MDVFKRSSSTSMFVSAPNTSSFSHFSVKFMKSFAYFLFPPRLVPPCRTAVGTDVTCLFGCSQSCQLRSASDPLLCQHLFCGRCWRTAGSAASGRRRAGRGAAARKRVALLKWEHDAAPASRCHPHRSASELSSLGEDPSQVAPTGRQTLVTAGPGRWFCGPLRRDRQQMGYATVTVTLPVWCEQSVSLCAVGCDAVRDLMWYYANDPFKEITKTSRWNTYLKRNF